MPSFIVHSVAGEELCKRLDFNKNKLNKFFVANLLPDTVQLERNPEWSSEELRKAIQKEKHVSHFRTDFESLLSYPDLKYFLNEYEELVKNDVIAFGYFFHLYTDYYYFSKFLPKIITFLCEDQITEALIKLDNKYNKINKTGTIMLKQDFWNKKNDDGIYGEYNRLNKYLIDKYNFKFNIDLYKKILNNKFKLSIKEIKIDGIGDLLEELNSFYDKSINSDKEDFKIFTEVDIDNLIKDIVDSFIDEYSYLFNKKNT